MHLQTIAQDDTFAGTRTGSNAGSRGALWTGRGLSALAVLFLVFDSVGKLLEVPPVVACARSFPGAFAIDRGR